MARMTRSSIKQEPTADPSYTPGRSTIRQLPNRAQSISSSTTPTPEIMNVSSGSTTIPDPDVDIARTPSAQNGAQTQDAQDGLATMSATSKDLIQAVQNIACLGMRATLPPLPGFVVVGDQSAGKSSVIQAICNITLPRSEGTTTRCPFLITTTASKVPSPHPWTCTIQLEHQYTFDPSATGTETTFRQWRLRADPDIYQVAELHDQSQLEHWLKIAQAAILNPSQNPATFTNNPSPKNSEVAFSPNVVRLQIKSPGLLDLSFFDLPGLISYHDHEDDQDQAVVEFIEELAEHYIKSPNNLILFACSALQDCETTLALRLIMRAKATDRCIGVMTKPDQVPPMDLNKCQIPAVMNEKKIRLGGKWFVTRQSSPAENARRITYEEARQQERNFFEQQPWSTAPFPDRLGTPALQVYIAKRLRDHIICQLPKIQDAVEDQMRQVANDLANFPEQDGHPIATVSSEIQRIVATVRDELGDRSSAAFREGYYDIISRFETSLAKACPEMNLATPMPEIIDVDALEEERRTSDRSSASTPTPSKFTTPSKKRPLPMGSRPPSTSKRVKPEPVVQPPLRRPRFTLKVIRDVYNKGCASGIAGERQPEVTDRLSLAAIKTWDPIVNTLLTELEIGVKTFVGLCIDQDLAARKDTKLRRSSIAVANRLVAGVLAEQGERITATLASEQHATFTSGEMDHYREEWREKVLDLRLPHRINNFFDAKQKANPAKIFSKADRDAKLADDKWQQANLPKDVWAEEVEAFVKPLAYYTLASRRFQETVKSGLEWGFVHQICERLDDRLKQELDANDVDKCSELLREQPERERERQALLAEQGKLEAAMAELAGLSGENKD